ncbi:MAG: carboxypeptidase-like regulatory domain-containing protein [Bryobacteraceae bacterium]
MSIRTFFGILVAVCTLSASQVDRPLRGRVSDGATPVVSAIITISNHQTVMSVATDSEGRFALQGVPAGRYDLRVSADGYAVLERSVVVHAHEPHRNWIDVNGLIPADRQTVSVNELLAHKETRSR